MVLNHLDVIQTSLYISNAGQHYELSSERTRSEFKTIYIHWSKCLILTQPTAGNPIYYMNPIYPMNKKKKNPHAIHKHRHSRNPPPFQHYFISW